MNRERLFDLRARAAARGDQALVREIDATLGVGHRAEPETVVRKERRETATPPKTRRD